jgi:hypothetical protein
MRIVPMMGVTVVQVVDVPRVLQACVTARLVVLMRSVDGMLAVGHLSVTKVLSL